MEKNVIIFFFIGAIAQLIDGSLGMAYGVISNTALLGIGLLPSAASASVHISEVFTTFASGISHFKLKNVNMKLVLNLAIPGIIGGIAGAYIISNLPGKVIKPYINAYLIIMGIIIFIKAFVSRPFRELKDYRLWILGTIGGFFDSIGGGGWGPIVTSNLVASGYEPRYVVGSVNLSEFFLTAAQAATFITLIGVTENWHIIAAITAGGILISPLAAMLTKKIPVKLFMIIVGSIVILLNAYSLIKLLFKTP